MAQKSTSEKKNTCTQNSAKRVCYEHGAETSACDSDPLQVISKTDEKSRPSGDRRVAVFRLGQSLKEEPALNVSRGTAREYVACGVARWTAGGKKLQLLRDPLFRQRGRSAQMGPKLIEQAAQGQHKELTAAWQPQKTRRTMRGDIDTRPLEPAFLQVRVGRDKTASPSFSQGRQEHEMKTFQPESYARGQRTSFQKVLASLKSRSPELAAHLAEWRSEPERISRQKMLDCVARSRKEVGGSVVPIRPTARTVPMTSAEMRSEYLRLLKAS